MDNKCNSYENLFIFSDEKTIAEHVMQCEQCRCEHEKMQKVSNLINEVKPKLKKNPHSNLKAACLIFVIITGIIPMYFADKQYGIFDTIKYGRQLEMVDLGIPTDNYGLIMVD